MDHIIVSLMTFSIQIFVRSAPIQNGFTVKFNPISSKEDIAPKTFGALFAKIPQEFNPKDDIRKEFISKVFIPNSTELGTGCTNQIAKLMRPMKTGYNFNDSDTWYSNINLLNLPLIQQPYDEYKILVATAPPNIKFGEPDGRDLVIYVVFPEDSLSLTNLLNMPKIFFVNERNGKLDIDKKEEMDPILIIDSNRTVTGLKSKTISKFVKFKSKLLNRFNYKVTQ